MLAVYGQKLNFHLHLYLLSLRPCVGQGWHSAHTAPWGLEPVNQLSFDQWVSVSGYNRAHFYCPRFKFSHRDFVGEGAGAWDDGVSCSITISRGLMDHAGLGQHPRPACPHTLSLRFTIIEPIPGQKLISRLWELPTTKYSNGNWKNKQTQRGETGNKMCRVIYQAGAGESCVLSPSVVFTITRTHFPFNERRSQPFDLARTICILFLPDSAAFFLHWGCSKFALRVSPGGAES